jgi:hypothetical protein
LLGGKDGLSQNLARIATRPRWQKPISEGVFNSTVLLSMTAIESKGAAIYS